MNTKHGFRLALTLLLAMLSMVGTIANCAELIKPAAGPGASTGSTSTCTGGVMPVDELMDFIRIYESGNLVMLQAKLDPSMLGLQRFLDGVIRDLNQQKQIRLFIKDVQVQCGTDLATVQFNWEKRYLDVASFVPALLTGRSVILMHHGNAGNWRIAAFAGDNPFSSQAGTLGQVLFGPAFALTSVSAIPTTVAVTLQVIDSDLAGLGSLMVQVVTSQGDAETISLPETSPGRFSRNSLLVSSGAVAQGNGIVEVGNGVQLTLRYIDQNPGNNLPPTMLTQTLRPIGTILIAPDITPDPFSFLPVTNAVASTPVTSNAATITGINAPTTISIVGGEYSANSGAFKSAGGVITNGQQIQLRVLASPISGASAMATVNVGGVTATFTVTTGVAPPPPPTNVNPGPITLNAISNAATGQTFMSIPVPVVGITGPSPVTITGGNYSINNGAFTAAAGVVNNGDSVVVSLVSSASNLTTVSATLRIGAVQGTFSVTTAALVGNATPNPFSYSPQTNVAPSASINSLPATISGINIASPVTVAGGTYSINGGPFTAAAGSITNNQTLVVNVLASAAFGATTSATVNVGGVAATFSVTTLAAATTPNPFTFTAQSNVAPRATITSNSVTITGINTASPVSIVGGTYSINGGPFTAAAGSITNNQTITLQLTSSPITDGTGIVSATLNVGGVMGVFSVTTVDTTPNPFAFFALVTTRAGVPSCVTLTSQFTTAPVTISGISGTATVSLTPGGVNPGASMSINGGAFTTGPAAISNGQTIVVRINTAGNTGGTLVTRATVNIGGVTANVTQSCQ